MNELLPCPFCGSNEISSGEVMLKHGDIFYQKTACLNCNAEGPEVLSSECTSSNRADDIAWNTRA